MRAKLRDANPPSPRGGDHQSSIVKIKSQLTKTHFFWGKNFCFSNAQKEREREDQTREQRPKQHPRRRRRRGERKKRAPRSEFFLIKRERERVFLPLEFNSFLCASKRRRFCVPSRTAISNASTLLLKNGLRPI